MVCGKRIFESYYTTFGLLFVDNMLGTEPLLTFRSHFLIEIS